MEANTATAVAPKTKVNISLSSGLVGIALKWFAAQTPQLPLYCQLQ